MAPKITPATEVPYSKMQLKIVTAKAKPGSAPRAQSSNASWSSSSTTSMNHMESGSEALDINSLSPPLTPSRTDALCVTSNGPAKVVWNSGNDAFAVKQKPANAWGAQSANSAAVKLFPETENTNATHPQSQQFDWSFGPVSSNDWGFVEETPTASEWVTTEETAEEKEKARFDEAMKGWPWSGNPPQLKTIAPWASSGHPWNLPSANNNINCPLFSKLLVNDVVADILMKHIFENYGMACRFAVLCQDSFNFGSCFVHLWDMTNGYFQDCERPRIYRYDMVADPSLENQRQGSVRPVLIVTPVRTGNAASKHAYREQVQNVYTMCIAANNFCDTIKNIQFHRVPFLTVHLLELLVPKMYKLEYLGVFNCPLIHVGHTLFILSIIDKQADARPKLNSGELKKWAKVDFYPRFHFGPPDEYDGDYDEKYAGSYGVTWDNCNMDSRQAIWTIVYRSLIKAKKMGIEFAGENSAFRRWLYAGPCFFVDEVLSRMLNPHKHGLEDLAAWIRYDKFRGKTSRLLTHHAFPQGQHNRGWATRHIPCRACGEHVMGIFYHFDDLRPHSPEPPICMGCRLNFILDDERDHYKIKKRNVISKWLTTTPDFRGRHRKFNTSDVSLALKEFNAREILEQATMLEKMRLKDVQGEARGLLDSAGMPIRDRELRERQIPIGERERRQKVGMRWRSPQIHDSVAHACNDRLDHHTVKW